MQAPAFDGCGGGEKATAREGRRADGKSFPAGHRQAEIWQGGEGQVCCC